eukprot:Clim_evm30s231 gene=Clim_evmTU30s231
MTKSFYKMAGYRSREDVRKRALHMSKTRVYQLMRAATMMDRLRDFEIRPHRERIYRALYIATKRGLDVVRGWRTVLSLAKDDFTSISESLVRATASSLINNDILCAEVQDFRDVKEQYAAQNAEMMQKIKSTLDGLSRDDEIIHAGYTAKQAKFEEWNTPKWFVQKVSDFLAWNPWCHVRATKVFGMTKDYIFLDALREKWIVPEPGTVFMNPPGGVAHGQSLNGLFCKKLLETFDDPTCGLREAVVLLPCSPTRNWLQPLIREFPHVFLGQQFKFELAPFGKRFDEDSRKDRDQMETGQDPVGRLLLYLGPRTTDFCRTFGPFGICPGFNSWSYGRDGDQDFVDYTEFVYEEVAVP